MLKIFLDDKRTPPDEGWTICRNFFDFKKVINENKITDITIISFDHDLGDKNEDPDDIDHYFERNGLFCGKWLISRFLNRSKLTYFPMISVHSSNPPGSLNIASLFSSFFKNMKYPGEISINSLKYKSDDK